MIRKLFKRLTYKFYKAPLGGGNPVPSTLWNEQFENGIWNYLGSIDEMAHYMIIAGYVLNLKADSNERLSILDVGCGHGVLYKYLSAIGELDYTGIDISYNAIQKATQVHSCESARFMTAGLETWNTDTKFDVIIFNESLYYAENPCDIICKYRLFLEAQGKFVISMCNYGNHRIIYQKLLKHLKPLHSTFVRNPIDQEWNIYLFEKYADEAISSDTCAL